MIKEYARQTDYTALYPESGQKTAAEKTYLALGLAGETGEAVDCVKKIMRNKGERYTAEQEAKLFYELGDVLWYWVRLCEAFNFEIEEVMKANIEKLKERHKKD